MSRQSSERTNLSRADRGLTLIELLISMTLTFIIGGVITAALITSLNAADSTARSAADSTDAQLIAAYLTRDAQAAGGTDPATAALDPLLGVSTTDAAGCTQSGSLVVRFAWSDRRTTPTSRVVVNYSRRSDGQLVRRACTGATAVEATLARNVTTAIATCSPGGTCGGLPDTVTMAVTGGASATPFNYSLTASLRADAQTSPDSNNSATVPLVALRTGTCPALSLGGTATVYVRGDAVLSGACGAAPVAGDTTLLRVAGTSSMPSAASDPFSSLTTPGSCPASGANPTIGSSTGPTDVTVYPAAVSITSATVFQAGRHVFCHGVTVASGASVTGTGVLWYVADGAVSVAPSATIDLTPATTGVYRNLSLWAAGTQGVAITGGSSVDSFAGVVYAPRAAVAITSVAGVRLGGIVADTVTTAGTGPIRLGLPIPTLAVLPGSSFPDGQLAVPYSASAPSVTGGTTPITYTATGLPGGLTMSTSGAITGTPTAYGTFSVSVLAVDATGASIPISRTLFVSAAPIGCPLTTSGWWGQYWTNDSLTGTATLCRADPTLSFDWGVGSPNAAIPTDNFSARWTRVQDFTAGTYDFTIGSDDGVRLYIDGTKIFDRWTVHGTTYDTVRTTLTAGSHIVVLEYYEAGGVAVASLSWVQPSLTCPANPSGWQGEYFGNPNLMNPSWSCQDDPVIDFNWAAGKPVGVPASDLFSVRWTRTQQFLAGTYTFAVGGDDGVRLLVDGVPVIDSWVETAYSIRTASRTLAAGPHTIVMEYYENYGYAQASLAWTVPVVPGVPANVTATPGDTTAAVAWTQGVTSGEPTTSVYTVTATAAGQPTRTCTSAPPATTCTLSGLVNGAVYAVTVTATNSIGISPASNSVSVAPRPAVLATSSVRLWLDAADSSTMFTDTAGTTVATTGQAVARWNDKSAAGNHLTQSTSTRQPLLGAHGSRQVPVFDGTTDTLTRSTSTMPVGTAASTTFAVAERTGVSTYGTVVGWGPNAGGQIRYFGTGDTRRYITTNGLANPTGTEWPAAAPGLLVGQFASATGTLWADGAAPVALAGTFNTTNSALAIGANSNIQFWNGPIDEVVVFDRVLTATERRSVEEYLARKWGVVITPSAPAVTLAPGNNAVTVSWTPGWDGGSAITTTQVVTSPGGSTCTATAPATSCTIGGLTNGTAYTFTVTHSNAIGVGASATVGPATPGPPPAPTAAAGIGGTNSVLVYWRPPTLVGHAPLTSSTVVATASGQTTQTCTAPGAAVACLVTGLTNDVAYTFTVTTSNINGASPAITAVATPTVTVLDQMTAVPVAAYGLRKLDNDYTGPAVRVRRSRDDTTIDIGFVAGGQLDVNTLMAFVGTGDGYISVHYDQSGNGRNAIQTDPSQQPRIVVTGVLAAINGRPGADASNNRGVLSNAFTSFTMGEVAAVLVSPTTTWANYHDVANHDGPRNGTILQAGGDDIHYNVYPAVLRKNGVEVPPYTSLSPITTPFLLDIDLTQASAARTRVGYGNYDVGAWGGAAVQAETLVFGAPITDTDRTAMTRNQSAHFGITLGTNSGVRRTLDRMTAAPAAAYGLRPLDGDYVGPAVRVRRSSDSATLDIGFTTGGQLDTSALLAFVGAGDGFVTTWYDQSGNGRNLTQPTPAYQPRIVNGGVVETKNGRPTIRQATKVDGMGLQTAWNFSGSAVTASAVTSLDPLVGDYWKGLVSIGTAGQDDQDSPARGVLLLQNLGNSQIGSFRGNALGPTTTITSGTQLIATSIYDGTNAVVRANGIEAGTAASTGTFSTSLLAVGTRLKIAPVAGPEEWVGTYSEVLVFPSALTTSDRARLEGDQGLFYGIQIGPDTASTPVLDQISAPTPVAAYGLRKLRAAYGGPAIRVRRSSDNATADIGFTATGQLDLQALIAFVGTADGFVTIHYDQSGNGRNAVQTTPSLQPRIVRNGYVASVGARPGVDSFSDRGLLSVAGTGFTMGEVAAVVQSPITVFPAYHDIANHDGVRNGTILQSGGTGFHGNLLPATLFRNGIEVAPSVGLAPVETPVVLDAELVAQSAVRTRVGYGNYDTGTVGGSLVQGDTLVFPSSLTDTDRALITRNLAAYYGVTIPATTPTPRTLDRLTTAPAAAYALRQLDADYTGPLVRVRRSSDNATLDVGANATTGQLDTAALLTFVGSGDGFVVTWYDQSGNSRNLSQSAPAAQPRLVTAGALETKNGRPTIRQLNGVNGTGLLASWSFTGTTVTASSVASLDTAGGDFWKGLVSIGNTGTDDWSGTDRGPLLLQNDLQPQIATYRNDVLTGSASVTTGIPVVANATYDGTAATLRLNGVAATATPSSGSFATTQLAVGQRIVAAPGEKYEWVGTYSEVVLFPAALGGADRTTLEGEQGLYYGIQLGPDSASTPVLDQTSAPVVAAYGLRRLRAAYSGPAIQVRRSSDNATADIGFTASGQLDLPALIAFVGNGDGYVSVHYDQSGNGRHAVQTEPGRQPRIMRNGYIAAVGQRPGVDTLFDRGVLSVAGTGFRIGEATAVLVSPTATWIGYHGMVSADGDRFGTLMQAGGNGFHGNVWPTTLRKNGGDLPVGSSLAPLTTPFQVDVEAGNQPTVRTRVGYGNYDAGVAGGSATQGETLVFARSLTDDERTAIAANQTTYYGITLAASSTTPRTLDRIGTAPAAAYALRKLDADYTGPAVRVRRSSDNTTADIGFQAVSGRLDLAALAAFVGGGDGFVVTWYDQSGNGRHLTQPTAALQPRLVAAGVVETRNGRPVIRQATKVDGMGLTAPWTFNGSALTASVVGSLDDATGDTGKGLLSIGTVGQDDATSVTGAAILIQNGGSAGVATIRDSAGPATAVGLGASVVLGATYDGTNVGLRANGTDVGTIPSSGTFVSGVLAVGTRLRTTAGAAPEEWVGTYSEVVVFASALPAAERGLLEREQGAANGINVGTTTPVLDGLATAPVGAWGLRRLDADYVGPAITVRRNSDSTTADIGFTADGQLDVAALIAFVGSSDGFVTAQYDQSGNGRTLVQPYEMRQPRIVRSGNVVLLNGRPAIDMSGDRSLQSVAGAGFTMAEATTVLVSPTANWPAYHDLASHDGARNGTILQSGATTFHGNVLPATLRKNGVDLATSASLAPITTPFVIDIGLANSPAVRTIVGYGNYDTGGGGGAAIQGDLVVMPTVLSPADRTTLERDLGAWYGIPVA